MKKYLIIILMVLLIATVVLTGIGCKSEAATESAATESAATESAATESAATEESKDKVVLGVALVDLTNEFFVNMVEGGNDAAEDYGAEVIWKSSDGNFDKQIALCENFIEQKVDCILVDPMDIEGIKPVIEKASEAGIPTITMAGVVEIETNYNTFYNDYEDTKVIAQILANLIGKEGKIALLFGNKGNFVSDLRQNGFLDGIANFPDIEVIEQPTNWDPATGLKVMQDILAANSDLVGYHCVSDAVTLASYEAVKSAGKTEEIVVTSFDGNIEASEAVKNGELALTLLTGSKRVGYWNVKIACEIARGNYPAENTLNMPTHFVMNDDLKEQVENWGLAKGISIVVPDEAIKLFNQYREDLGPK